MNKINAAEAATRKVQDHAFKAAEVLRKSYDGRIMVNAYGILVEPDKRGSDLRIARDEINKALSILEATNWPTDSDYDAAERAPGFDDGAGK